MRSSRPAWLRLLVAAGFGLAALVAASDAQAKVFMSRKEAIASAFPEAERVDEQTYVLDDAQAQAIEGRARSPLDSRLVTVYTGIRAGQVLGHALIDVHTVRTLPEAFLVVLTPEGRVRTLRMVAFYEPSEYLPPKRWLAQFESQRLGPELRLQGRIHGIAGATLSSRAVMGGVRRALALWEVVLRPGIAPGLAAGPGDGPSVAGR